MRIDSQLNFLIGSTAWNLAVGTASNPSPNLIDLAGVGSGVAPPAIIGNTLLFGEDVGVGDGLLVPKLMVTVGTAFTTSNSATLNLALQGAPDTGAAGGYLPGTWQTFVETGALTAAQLTLNSIIARFDWPPQYPITLAALPRFFRLLATLPGSTAFTAGTISFASVTSVRDDQANKFAVANYKVA